MGYEDKNNWIWSENWGGEDLEVPRIVLFRREYLLKEKPKAAVLDISADTRYKLYVNGNLAETGPCKGDRQVWFWDRVDITRWLTKGENAIAVSVLRYPEDPTKGNHGMFRTSTPGLYVKGSITDEAGEEYPVLADSSWKCRIDKKVRLLKEEEHFAPLCIHEEASGDPSLSGWRLPGYKEKKWGNAFSYVEAQMPKAVSPGNLLPRPIPYLYRKNRKFKGIMDRKKSIFSKEEWGDFLNGKRALCIPENTEELVEIDAGEEMTGYIYLGLGGGKNAEIQLMYAESYIQDELVGPAKVPLKKDRTDKENGHLDGYKDIYHAGGYGTEEAPETYEPYWFRTFRFIQLRIRTGKEPLILNLLDYEETGYPLKVKTSVEVSDESMKDIWEISERTLRRCMHETYEDCPYYEQLQYVMDSRTQILYTYAVSGDDRLARKCMDDLCRSQRYDGLLNCCYPNCNPNVIPGFSIYYILMVYDHMMYFGDKELVREYMPCIEKILDFFRKNLTLEGYVGQVGSVISSRFWSFIDWADEWNPTSGMPPAGLKGAITMESLLYIYGLQHGAKLMEFLGRNEDADYYLKEAKEVQKAILAFCMGSNGMIQDGPGVEEYSQHCQVFALLTDTVDKETGRKNLLKTVEEPGYAQCTVAMRFYLFRALEKAGIYEYSKKYWDSWRNMLKLHCTTCIESDAYSRSECHAWGALALYELPSVILGVRPAEPGYKSVRIAPVPGYMTYASGTAVIPGGEVWVRWTKKDGSLKLEYKVPEGIKVVH